MTNKLILVRGIPGTGKSTYAHQLLQENVVDVHLEADMYHFDKGKYEWIGDRVTAAHKWCQDSTKIFLNAGLNVVVSNTFTQEKEITPYTMMAKFIGVPVEVHRCFGQYQNVHGVPQDRLDIMAARFIDYPGELFVPNGD